MNLSLPIIKNLTDYVMFNASSSPTSGLYEGKAGHALCLFEMARFLNDDYLEEFSSVCLQEALVSKTDRIDFGFGQSGIGYVLLYLIHNQFIRADFHELFGIKQSQIFSVIRLAHDPSLLISLIPFLVAYSKQYPQNNEVKKLITSAIDASLKKLASYPMSKREHIEFVKEGCDEQLQQLLHAIWLIRDKDVEISYNSEKLHQVCQDLNDRYQRGGQRRLLSAEFYIRHLFTPNHYSAITAISRKHLDRISTKMADLSEMIRRQVILTPSTDISHDIDLFDQWTDNNIEEQLLYRIGTEYRLSSLNGGVARFLLYYLYSNGYAGACNPTNRLFPLLI